MRDPHWASFHLFSPLSFLTLGHRSSAAGPVSRPVCPSMQMPRPAVRESSASALTSRPRLIWLTTGLLCTLPLSRPLNPAFWVRRVPPQTLPRPVALRGSSSPASLPSASEIRAKRAAYPERVSGTFAGLHFDGRAAHGRQRAYDAIAKQAPRAEDAGALCSAQQPGLDPNKSQVRVGDQGISERVEADRAEQACGCSSVFLLPKRGGTTETLADTTSSAVWGASSCNAVVVVQHSLRKRGEKKAENEDKPEADDSMGITARESPIRNLLQAEPNPRRCAPTVFAWTNEQNVDVKSLEELRTAIQYTLKRCATAGSARCLANWRTRGSDQPPGSDPEGRGIGDQRDRQLPTLRAELPEIAFPLVTLPDARLPRQLQRRVGVHNGGSSFCPPLAAGCRQPRNHYGPLVEVVSGEAPRGLAMRFSVLHYHQRELPTMTNPRSKVGVPPSPLGRVFSISACSAQIFTLRTEYLKLRNPGMECASHTHII
ncbi:hypothetical protein C8Q70DRAFT_936172 [Cubamyces menziesii]|nr:hypothetical protein C8Q70DRAFT_936172 [Cubamyces menziesii]